MAIAIPLRTNLGQQNLAKNEDLRKGMLPSDAVIHALDQTFSSRYLSALESRLHEAEALLGVIISSNDIRAKTLVFDLAKDSLASTIIKRVTESVFGPIGRESLRVRGAGGSCSDSQSSPTNFRRPTDSRRQQMNSREVAMMGDDGMLPLIRTIYVLFILSRTICRQSRIHNSQQHLARLP